jgi:hypothetical protein
MANKLFKKINKIRVELMNKDIKKSGKNTYSKFSYFLLDDFSNELNNICCKHNVYNEFVPLSSEMKLNIYDLDSDEMVHYQFKYPEDGKDGIKGGMNFFQKKGSYWTYTQRYLLCLAYQINNGEDLDAFPQENNTIIKKNDKLFNAKKYYDSLCKNNTDKVIDKKFVLSMGKNDLSSNDFKLFTKWVNNKKDLFS